MRSGKKEKKNVFSRLRSRERRREKKLTLFVFSFFLSLFPKQKNQNKKKTGIVQNDWTTVDWNKIRYLESVGLKPWYKNNNGTQPVPPPPSPSPTPPPPTTLPPPPTTTTPPPTTKPPTPPPTTLPPTPPPTTTPPAPTTTPPQTWPVAPLIPPVTPAETRRGRRPPADGNEGDGGVLGSDIFVSGDAAEAGSSATATPLQAPLPTPSPATSDEINNEVVEVAVDESSASASASPPIVNNAPSISNPPPPVSLGAMVGEIFSWAAQDASPPLQPGGSTGEAAASSESFGGDGRPLSTRGPLLLGSDGAPFDLKAVSWPGFDAAETGGWLRGLSPASSSSPSPSAALLPTTADADARTQFARMRALGFTAVKFPFSMPVVLGKTEESASAGAAGAAAAASSSSSLAPEVECSVTPEAEVRDATAPASSPPTAWNHWPEGAELPKASTTTQSPTQKCNAGAPPFASSAAPPLARLAWAAARAAEAGLYVVLEDAGATAAEDPALWVDGWSRVAAAVANAPLEEGKGLGATVGSRLALRLLADPDALSLSWATPGDAAAPSSPKNATTGTPPPPSLRRLALAAMDSLSRVAPSALLLVPGGGQAALFRGGDSSSSSVVLTGAGFATDPAALAAAGVDPLASADGFLTELVGTRAAYLDRVVLSPTLGIRSDGKNGDKESDSSFPSSQKLWRALDASFGELTSRGHCLNGGGSCHRFAVVVGGLGGTAWASEGAARLRSDLSAWLQPTCGLPACASAAGAAPGAGRRPAVRSWSWGDWKGGSESSSSLLLPPQPSSSSSAVPLVDWKVVEWLQRGLGLLPWTAAPSTAWREGPGPAPTDVLRAAGDPSSSSGTASAESEGGGGAAAAAMCAAVYSVDARGSEASSGSGNSSSAAVASVVLTLANLGRAAAIAPPFVVSMSQRQQQAGGKEEAGGKAGGYSAVLQAHGVAPGSAHVVAGTGSVRARVSDPWSVLWPSAGSSVSVSLVVRGGNGGGESGGGGAGGAAEAAAAASSSPAAAALSLAPTEVSINGVPCSVSKAADSTASAEGEGFSGAATRSVMQTSRGFPLQQAAV